MTSQQTTSGALNISLWIAQALICLTLLWGSGMKLFMSTEELAAMWPWAGEISPVWVKLTGVIDLLGGVGVILPGVLRIRPGLVVIASVCIILLMICAVIFHVLRGEAANIAPNIVVASIAAFIGWGRSKTGY